MVGSISTVSCKQPRSLARAPLPQEVGVYRAGPLLLVTGEDLAQLPDGQVEQGSGVDAIAAVRSNRPVTLSVDRTAPVSVSLQFADPPPAGATPSVFPLAEGVCTGSAAASPSGEGLRSAFTYWWQEAHQSR